MIVLLILAEKNDNYVSYNYGYDSDNLDGQIKVYFNDPKSNYEVVKESKDKHIGKKGTVIVISKVIRAIEQNEIKEKLSYES